MSLPLTDGQTILAADLNSGAATTAVAALGFIQTDNALLPLRETFNFYFHNLVTGTPLLRRRAVMVVPFDCYVEVLAAQGNEHTAASSLTVALTGYVSETLPTITIPGATGNAADISGDTGPLANFPIVVSGTVGAGINRIARNLMDNTKVKIGKFTDKPKTTRMLTVLLRGSTIQITASTTSAATPSMTHVALTLREFLARE